MQKSSKLMLETTCIAFSVRQKNLDKNLVAAKAKNVPNLG